MSPTRVGLLSIHSSPFAPLGSRDAGGMNLYIQKLALGLGELGFQVDVLTRRSDPRSACVQEVGRNTRLIQLDGGPAKPVPKSVLPLFVPQLADSFRCFIQNDGLEYDVVHGHYWLSGLVAARHKEESGTPVVQMFHTLARIKEFYYGQPDPADSMLRADGERSIIERADAVIGATWGELDEMSRLYGRAPTIYEVIPPGVDTELFQPLDQRKARRSLGLPMDGRIVLFVGRLDPIKGLERLMRSIAEIRGRVPGPLTCLVVGEHGPGERDALARYRGFAMKLGIADAVCFHDIVDQPRLRQIYAAADVCAVPSAYESFGMVAIEAMACQTPVVAYRVGGLAATVRDGDTGYLAQPGSQQDFSEKLARAIADTDRLRTMGRRARLSVQRYRWQCAAERTAALYRRVIRSRVCAVSCASGQG